MIHILDDNYIDISKLERVSKIILSSSPYGHYFRYSVNGFTWDTNISQNETRLITLREDLLH